MAGLGIKYHEAMAIRIPKRHFRYDTLFYENNVTLQGFVDADLIVT